MEISIDYLAGLFDGEGSIGIYSNGKTNGSVVRVQTVQNINTISLPMWQSLAGQYGGYVTYTISSSGRPKMNWQMSGKTAVDFLRFISPHLIMKKPQADLVISWFDSRPPLLRVKGRIQARTEEDRIYTKTVMTELREMKLDSTDIPV